MSKETVYKVKVTVTETFFAPNETEAHGIAQDIAYNFRGQDYELIEVGEVVWFEPESHLKLVK